MSNYINLFGPKPYKKDNMSRLANTPSDNRPPPPPPPPPLRSDSPERRPKPKSSKPVTKSDSLGQNTQKKSNASSIRRYSDPASISSSSSRRPPPSPSPSPLKQPVSDERFSRRSPTESDDVISIERNDVSFFDEESCADSDDEFNFTCCIPPYSPRYPPNPRPVRDWDPSFLPSGTNIPTSIGKPCRRCGKLVYLAELHLSSRGAYHSECYKCCLCGKSLDSWSVAEYKGEVFCKGCYRRNFSTHGTGFGVGAGVLQTP